MGKKILQNTILFIAILAFVVGFKTIFGEENTLVGVTVIMSVLILMTVDLTKNSWKSFWVLVIVNVLLGFFSYITNYNMWIGIVIDFITIGSIGYFLSYNLNKILIVPFGLQYLFMLYKPVYGRVFAYRIAGLIAGAAFIMIVQLIVHRKKKIEEAPKSDILTFDERDNQYENVKVFGRNFSVQKVRARYAIRVGMITALTIFAVDYFNLENGKWIVYTLFSLTELYSENCKIKSRQRLQGTIIGAVIILVVFMFVKSTALRGLMILLFGYLNSYAENYRDKMICTTISAVASVALVEGTLITVAERLIYVGIGIILALLVNRFVLHTSKESYGTSEE